LSEPEKVNICYHFFEKTLINQSTLEKHLINQDEKNKLDTIRR